MPHGDSFLWRPDIFWLHVGADFLTALAFFLIPAALVTSCAAGKTWASWGANSLFPRSRTPKHTPRAAALASMAS